MSSVVEPSSHSKAARRVLQKPLPEAKPWRFIDGLKGPRRTPGSSDAVAVNIRRENSPPSTMYPRRRIGDVAGSGDALAFNEMGNVISVGDGIARVYGLNSVQAGEMVEFACGLRGMALNQKSRRSASDFGDDPSDFEGDARSSARARSSTCLWEKVCWAASSMAWANLLTVLVPSRTCPEAAPRSRPPASSRDSP